MIHRAKRARRVLVGAQVAEKERRGDADAVAQQLVVGGTNSLMPEDLITLPHFSVSSAMSRLIAR
jgi:hypothetical protein